MHALVAAFLILSASKPGQTHLLVEAAQSGNRKSVRALVAGGVDVNRAEGDGTTPALAAAASGQVPVLEALVDAGADLDLRDRLGRTALDLAQLGGHPDAVRWLRAHGALGSGKSPGDTVCVAKWAQNGFCGTIEGVEVHRLRVRVTRVEGCGGGCAADRACSDGQEILPSSVGQVFWVSRSCLTTTYPGSGAAR